MRHGFVIHTNIFDEYAVSTAQLAGFEVATILITMVLTKTAKPVSRHERGTTPAVLFTLLY
jgi:hypothetical protein